jgi:hypothetical protein
MLQDFQVMQNLDDRFVLVATELNFEGRAGFWFSDYTYETSAEAWQSEDLIAR